MRSNARLCVALLVSEAGVDINRQRSAVGLCCLSKRLCVILYVKDCTVAEREYSLAVRPKSLGFV